MANTSICFASIQGAIMRATRVDACGTPLTGVGGQNKVVSDGFVSIALAAQIEDGTEYKLKNAMGRVTVDQRGPKQLLSYDLTLTFTGVDPALFEMCTANRIVTDYKNDFVGVAVDRDQSMDGFALEVWTVIPSGLSTPCDSDGQFVYWLMPWVYDSALGDFTIADAAMDFVIHSRTRQGSRWGRGVYNVVGINASDTPGILDAPGVLASEHVLFRQTTVPPPLSVCGYS